MNHLPDNSSDNSIEQIYDSALAELRRGKTIAEVLSAYPQHAEELQDLLEISAIGLSIPKNLVPTPLRRRKFAEKTARNWWFRSVRIFKFGVMPFALALMLFGGKTLVTATEQSLPNDSLYTLKRATEQLQVTLTRDADKQANLQLTLTQRRLTEVQQAVASNDPAQEAAALSALEAQTEKTFATVPQMAAAKALATKDSSLLDSLVAINKQQKEVLTAIQPAPETKPIADTALNTAKERGEALATLVATVQEQTLVDLKNKVTLTGEVALSQDKRRAVLDNTTFIVTEDTIITSSEGDPLKTAELTSKFAATVTGTKTASGTIAKFISLLPAEDSEVPTEEQPTTQPEPTPQPAPEPEAAPQPDQNEVTSGVIIEPPSNQP